MCGRFILKVPFSELVRLYNLTNLSNLEPRYNIAPTHDITTEPNELCAPIHNRMPAILAPESFGHWLGEVPAANDELLALLRPYPADDMRPIRSARRLETSGTRGLS